MDPAVTKKLNMQEILTGKAVIVTGATGGIGNESCRVLAAAGASLIVSDLNAEAGEALASHLRSLGGKADFVAADVRLERDVALLVERALSLHGRVDGAFNNAGVEPSQKPLAELSLDDWQKVIAIDLTGVFLCMKHQIRAMLRTGGGSIVNTAAAMTRVAFPNLGDYIAAKSGVIGLTRAAAVDYGKNHIRVNAILPGAIRTPMVDRLMEGPDFAAYFEKILDRHALGRMGQPSEVGQACAWLLSDMSSFVTGASIPVDGGFLVT